MAPFPPLRETLASTPANRFWFPRVPDGRGLSAAVTLPQGSVDNQGNLIADGGAIDAQAQTVNQNGLIQANSVQNVNGTIELVASDSLNVGANSVISANGDAMASSPSPAGFVVLQSGNSYADTPTSQINVNGQAGGQNGIVEISGANVTSTSVQSAISTDATVLENPYDITLSSNPSGSSAAPVSGDEDYNFNIAGLAAYSQIDLHALDNIELSTAVPWLLNDSATPASLSLSAGNNIILDNNSGIQAGNNWDVNLFAGTAYAPTTTQPTPLSGNDGIYLNGSGFISTQNGDINLWAANEVLVNSGEIVSLDGGNIDVAAQYGNVNAGSNPIGYSYQATAPYYTVGNTIEGGTLGGISTAAGGNVTISQGATSSATRRRAITAKMAEPEPSDRKQGMSPLMPTAASMAPMCWPTASAPSPPGKTPAPRTAIPLRSVSLTAVGPSTPPMAIFTCRKYGIPTVILTI